MFVIISYSIHYTKLYEYNAQVQLLIGQDHWRLLRTLELRDVPHSDLALSRTPLGWAVHGQANLKDLEARVTVMNLHVKPNEKSVRKRALV